MEGRVWAALQRRYGAERDDPSSWPACSATGLQGLKNQEVFEPIGGPTTRAALDELVGAGSWSPPKNWGQFLVGFPLAEAEWTVPSRGWHTDFPYRLPRALRATERCFGALLFAYLSDVPERAGGTVAIAGSHRFVSRWVADRKPEALSKMKVVRRAILDSDPWFRELGATEAGGAAKAPGSAQERIEQFMGRESEVDGVPLRVVELHADAGDVVLAHPWILHTGAPCTGTLPRLMRVQRIRPAL